MSSLLSVKLCVSSDEIATRRSSQFVQAPLREKLFARQLNSYTASGLCVSLKPYWTLVQTLEWISRICIFLLLYFWLDVQYFCQYLTNSSLCVNMRFTVECLFKGLTNCMGVAESYLAGQASCETRRFITVLSKARQWTYPEPIESSLHNIVRHISLRFCYRITFIYT